MASRRAIEPLSESDKTFNPLLKEMQRQIRIQLGSDTNDVYCIPVAVGNPVARESSSRRESVATQSMEPQSTLTAEPS